MGRFVKGFARLLGALLLLGVVALVVAAVVGVPIDLDRFRSQIERESGKALGRAVRVDGEIRLVVGLFPRFTLGGVEIANPPRGAWESPRFAELEEVRVALDLPALLASRIHVPEIAAIGGRATLERAPGGRANWAFEPREREPAAQPDPTGKEPASEVEAEPEEDASFEILGVDVESLTLRGMELRWIDRRAGSRKRYALDSLDGRITMDEPIELRLAGSLDGHPYRLSITGGPLGALTSLADRWPLELELEIARTRVTLNGEVEGAALSAILGQPPRLQQPAPERNHAQLGVEVRGERLDHLDSLVGVKLPPLGPYRVAARVGALEGDRFRGALDLRVGGSDLAGRLALDRSGRRPQLDVSLEAPRIQLDDFETGDWSAVVAEPDGSPTASAPAPRAEDAQGEPAALLTPEALRRLDAELTVAVAEVRSGRDVLGAGRLQASLRDGRLELRPLEVALPGGRIEVAAGFEPTATELLADARLQIERFDLGVLVRRTDPDATLGGTLFLDAALDTRAPDPTHPMHHANGHLILGLWPENLAAGIVDLWAVNLLAAVVPVVDGGQDSVIHCAVATLALDDGIMRERALMLDTSRMRVRGTMEVDFREEQVTMQLAPRAKRPQFFSLATPVGVSGSFEDFSIGVSAADLLATVVRLASSAVVVPIERVVRRPLPEDGSEDCMRMLDEARAEVAASEAASRQP